MSVKKCWCLSLLLVLFCIPAVICTTSTPLPTKTVAEEPVAEEPVAEEPAPKEPAPEEPALEEPALEEPALEEPALEEPALEEPALEEPAPEEPAPEEPTPEELAPEELAPEELTPEELAPEELAPEELAPEELAPEELAPEELAPEELAPEELAPEELAPEESAPVKTVPVESAEQPVLEEPALAETAPSTEDHSHDIEEPATLYIIDTSLAHRIRSGKSLDASIIGFIPDGEEIYGSIQIDGVDDEKWVLLKRRTLEKFSSYTDKLVGWVLHTSKYGTSYLSKVDVNEKSYILDTPVAHRIRASKSLDSVVVGFIPRGEKIYGSSPIMNEKNEQWVFLSKKTLTEFSETQQIGWVLHSANDGISYLNDADEKIYTLNTPVAHRIRASQSLSSPILGLIPRGRLIYGTSLISGSNNEKWVLLLKKTLTEFSESQRIGWVLHTASDGTSYLNDIDEMPYILDTPVAHRIRASNSLSSPIVGFIPRGKKIYGSSPIMSETNEKWVLLSKKTATEFSNTQQIGWVLHSTNDGTCYLNEPEEKVYMLDTPVAHRVRASQSLKSSILGLIPRGELIYGSSPMSGTNNEKWVLLSKKTMTDFTETQQIGWVLHTNDGNCYLKDHNKPVEDQVYIVNTAVAHRIRSDQSLKAAIIGLILNGEEIYGSEPVSNDLGEKWILLSKHSIQKISQDRTVGWALHTGRNGISFLENKIDPIINRVTSDGEKDQEFPGFIKAIWSDPNPTSFKWLLLLHLVIGWIIYSNPEWIKEWLCHQPEEILNVIKHLGPFERKIMPSIVDADIEDRYIMGWVIAFHYMLAEVLMLVGMGLGLMSVWRHGLMVHIGQNVLYIMQCAYSKIEPCGHPLINTFPQNSRKVILLRHVLEFSFGLLAYFFLYKIPDTQPLCLLLLTGPAPFFFFEQLSSTLPSDNNTSAYIFEALLSAIWFVYCRFFYFIPAVQVILGEIYSESGIIFFASSLVFFSHLLFNTGTLLVLADAFKEFLYEQGTEEEMEHLRHISGAAGAFGHTNGRFTLHSQRVIKMIGLAPQKTSSYLILSNSSIATTIASSQEPIDILAKLPLQNTSGKAATEEPACKHPVPEEPATCEEAAAEVALHEKKVAEEALRKKELAEEAVAEEAVAEEIRRKEAKEEETRRQEEKEEETRRQEEKEEETRRQEAKEEEIRRQEAKEEALLKQKEEALCKQEEALRKQQQEAIRKQEEEAIRKEEEALRKQEEETRRQKELAEETRRQKEEEETRRKQEEETRRKQEEETRRKQEEETRRKQEEEIRCQKAEETRRQKEEAVAEETRRQKAAEETRLQAEEAVAEETRQKAEEETRRQKAEETSRKETTAEKASREEITAENCEQPAPKSIFRKLFPVKQNGIMKKVSAAANDIIARKSVSAAELAAKSLPEPELGAAKSILEPELGA